MAELLSSTEDLRFAIYPEEVDPAKRSEFYQNMNRFVESAAMTSISHNSTVMGEISQSEAAMADIVESSNAMIKFSKTSTSINAIGTSGVAFDKIKANKEALARYISGYLDYQPEDYDSLTELTNDENVMADMANNSDLMAGLVTSQTAFNHFADSQKAMSAIATTSNAMDAVRDSATALNEIAATSTGRSALESNSTARNYMNSRTSSFSNSVNGSGGWEPLPEMTSANGVWVQNASAEGGDWSGEESIRFDQLGGTTGSNGVSNKIVFDCSHTGNKTGGIGTSWTTSGNVYVW